MNKASLLKSALSVLLIAVLTVATGCGSKISRCVLSGVVTSDGQPVPVGTVQFIPENPDPTLGVAGSSADIKDGTYTLTPETGLVQGKYKVRVIAIAMIDKQGNVVDPLDLKDGLVDPASCKEKDLVPPKFGKDTEQYVDVLKGKTMTYDINMVTE